MKLILTGGSVALLWHLLSFAAFYWKKQHRLAALGAALAGLAAFLLVLYVIFIGQQEL